jgi:hypothetical protein
MSLLSLDLWHQFHFANVKVSVRRYIIFLRLFSWNSVTFSFPHDFILAFVLESSKLFSDVHVPQHILLSVDLNNNDSNSNIVRKTNHSKAKIKSWGNEKVTEFQENRRRKIWQIYSLGQSKVLDFDNFYSC